MAEEANARVAVGASKPVDEPTRPVEAAEGASVVETKPADGSDVAPADAPAEEQAPKTAAAVEENEAAKDATIDAKPDTTVGEKDASSPVEDVDMNGTPGAGKKATNGRRKSAGTVPEHKSKKTPGKKKKSAALHLDTQPGDMWMVAMRGYQPWPVIICDEEMLPESLLSKRPVSAKRIDGTYREDFRDGGKNAKDRRYPIMFLGTNEFAWQVNTDLLPFNLEDVKKEVEAGNSTKKGKGLWDAYVIAAEGHDLEYFKNLISNHEQAVQEEVIAKQQKEEAKAKKAEKASKRKSTAAEESEDVDMEDAGDDAAASAKKVKGSKKRKKEDDGEDGPEKPAKTPKTKLKLTNKPKEASASKPKKESKPKKGKASEDEAEPAPVEEPPMTEEERLQKREKSVLYLRHRLQKGFLARDQAPKDEDMANMNGYLKQLEDLEDLEAEVIKNTKVHKVLKAIIRLKSIPKEEEFNFKQRSDSLLNKWSGALAADTEATGDASASAPPPTTNGVNHEDKKSDAPAPEKSDQAAEALETAKPADAEGDVSMADAKEEVQAAKPDIEPGVEGAAETAAA